MVWPYRVEMGVNRRAFLPAGPGQRRVNQFIISMLCKNGVKIRFSRGFSKWNRRGWRRAECRKRLGIPVKFVSQMLFMNKDVAPIAVWRATNFTFQIQKVACFVSVQPSGLNERRESPEEPLMKHNKSMWDASITRVYHSAKCQQQIVWMMKLFSPPRSKWVLSRSCLKLHRNTFWSFHWSSTSNSVYLWCWA